VQLDVIKDITLALDLPPELVLEKAGIYPNKFEHTGLVSDIAYKASFLKEKNQKVILRIIETLLEE
jgi:hypothetical protein